jgi:CRISPR/Cas system-associated endonuclease/helicase Cas3
MESLPKNNNVNNAIVATTGCGKTILAFDIFISSAIDDAPPLIFDFSHGGASTYRRVIQS